MIVILHFTTINIYMLHLERFWIPRWIFARNAKHLLNLRSICMENRCKSFSSWRMAVINQRTYWYPAYESAQTFAYIPIRWHLRPSGKSQQRVADEGKGCEGRVRCARTSEWTRFWGVQFRRWGSSVRYRQSPAQFLCQTRLWNARANYSRFSSSDWKANQK